NRSTCPIRARSCSTSPTLLTELREDRSARGGDARLDAERREQLAGGVHLVHAPHRMPAASVDEPPEERRSDHVAELRLEPLAAAGRIGGCEALERRRRDAPHEHRAEELQRPGRPR